MATLAFEIEDGVDHVLEHPRPGDQPFLGHMADQHDDEAAPLREADQLLRRAAHLADRSGGAVQRVEKHRLDRIDDDEVGRVCHVERGDDVAHAAGGGETDRAACDPEPLGAQPDLVDRLLAGYVGRRAAAACGERRRCLQQQGRLADAGIAADQQRRADHQAAAADAVELEDAALVARRLRRRADEAGEFEGPTLLTPWAAAGQSASGTGRGAVIRRTVSGRRNALPWCLPSSSSMRARTARSSAVENNPAWPATPPR